jgi:hypothetical protein
LGLVKARHSEPLDDLSEWVLPPPAARNTKPIRVFDTADAAIALLARLQDREFREAAIRPSSDAVFFCPLADVLSAADSMYSID